MQLMAVENYASLKNGDLNLRILKHSFNVQKSKKLHFKYCALERKVIYYTCKMRFGAIYEKRKILNSEAPEYCFKIKQIKISVRVKCYSFY